MKRNLPGPEGLAGRGASAALRGLAVEPTTAGAARLASAPSPSQRGSRGILRQAPKLKRITWTGSSLRSRSDRRRARQLRAAIASANRSNGKLCATTGLSRPCAASTNTFSRLASARCRSTSPNCRRLTPIRLAPFNSGKLVRKDAIPPGKPTMRCRPFQPSVRNAASVASPPTGSKTTSTGLPPVALFRSSRQDSDRAFTAASAPPESASWRLASEEADAMTRAPRCLPICTAA